MSEASFASLGPTLLARKGGAKPAMRPQLTPLPDNLTEMAALAEEQLEDLGWNDMGESDDQSAPIVSSIPTDAPEETADVVALSTKAPVPFPANEDTLAERSPSESPVVRKEQKRLEQSVVAANEERSTKSSAKKPTKPSQKTAHKSGKRAAFTLRLDTQRHLKLRLAATMQGVSAQALVTQALDAMFEGIEELDLLAARMQRD